MKIKYLPEDFYVEEIIDFPEQNGNYAYFRITKRNITTLQAIKLIANELKISRHRISFGGIKDKKAIATQYISIENLEVKENFFLKLNNLEMEFLGYFKEKMSPSRVIGNKFKIVVRELDFIYNVKAYDLIVKQGFPNYFDEQRFGDKRWVNHLIGKLILQRDYENAVKQILTSTSPQENVNVRIAREFLKDNWGNWKEALFLFPTYMDIERQILHKLAETNNYRKAIFSLPKRLLSLFVNSYQSYLFNRILSKFIENNCESKIQLRIGPSYLSFPLEELKNKVEYLPVLGYETKLGNSEIYEIVKEVLDEEEISLDIFKHERKFLSFRGDMRRAFVVPSDFRIEGILEDNIFYGKRMAMLSFRLPKGSYATMLVKYLFFDNLLVLDPLASFT